MAATPPKLLSATPVPTSRSNNLPKIQRNDVARAINRTMVQPAVNKVTSGIRSLNPLAMARNWAEGNPITRFGMDFKANLDDARHERDQPNREARAAAGDRNDRAGWNNSRSGGVRNPYVHQGGAPSDNGEVVEAIGRLNETTQSGFAGMVTELRSVRQNSITMVRNTNLQLGEQKRTTAGLTQVVNAIKELASGQHGQRLEDKIEGNKGNGTESEVGKKGNMLRNLLGFLAQAALGFVAQIRAGIVLFARSVRAGVAGLAARVLGIFKNIRMPAALLRLGESIGAVFARMAPLTKVFSSIGGLFARLGQILSPLMKIMGPIMGVVGRLTGFLKFVPVVGQVLMVLFAVFDGIKGFIKGWNSSDGNFFEKAWAGLKGAVVGIVKGFLSPFIWLGKLLWKGIKAIGEALSIDGFIKQLQKINFGTIWDKIVSAFKPTGNMLTELWDFFKKLLGDIGKKLLGVGTGTAQQVQETARQAGQAAVDVASGVGRAASSAVENTAYAARGPEARAMEARTAAAARAGGITNRNELAMFMAQTANETGNFTDRNLSENEYSAENVWRARGTQLQRHGVTLDQMRASERTSGRSAMFEYMYADKYRGAGHRLGNTQEGDGNRYRGRGMIQLTGRSNYRRMGQALGLPLEENPDLAADPEIAARIAVQFWKDSNSGPAAREGNVREVTRRVNGDPDAHIDRRTRNYNRYLADLSDGQLEVEASQPRTQEQRAALQQAERDRTRQRRTAAPQTTVNAPQTNVNNAQTTVVQPAPYRYDRSGIDSVRSWSGINR